MNIPIFRVPDWFDVGIMPKRIYLPTQTPGMTQQERYALRRSIVHLSVKKKVLDKYDLIPKIAEELESSFQIDKKDIKIRKLYIRFPIPNKEVNKEVHEKFLQEFRTHFREFVVKYKKVILFEKDTLQALLMNNLKNNEYKLLSCIHHSAKHGSQNTIDLLHNIDNVWSIRY
jgi:hypothetical protein